MKGVCLKKEIYSSIKMKGFIAEKNTKKTTGDLIKTVALIKKIGKLCNKRNSTLKNECECPVF